MAGKSIKFEVRHHPQEKEGVPPSLAGVSLVDGTQHVNVFDVIEVFRMAGYVLYDCDKVRITIEVVKPRYRNKTKKKG